jgi:hypothetical protein
MSYDELNHPHEVQDRFGAPEAKRLMACCTTVPNDWRHSPRRLHAQTAQASTLSILLLAGVASTALQAASLPERATWEGWTALRHGAPSTGGAWSSTPSSQIAARQDLLAVWPVSPILDVGYSLGSAEYQLGKYPGAGEHLSFALRRWPFIDAAPSLRKTAQQRFDASRAFVEALTVKVNGAHAEVFVDGKSVGKSPLDSEVFVEPETANVVARRDGYIAAQQTVAVGKGDARTIELTLVASAPDGAHAATSAPVPRRELIIAGSATAGAALIAGMVFTVLANERASTARDGARELIGATGPEACTRASNACREVAGVLSDKIAFSNAAAWSFIGAGVLGAATGIYAFATKRAPKIGVHATPVMTGQGAAVMVWGAW